MRYQHGADVAAPRRSSTTVKARLTSARLDAGFVADSFEQQLAAVERFVDGWLKSGAADWIIDDPPAPLTSAQRLMAFQNDLIRRIARPPRPECCCDG